MASLHPRALSCCSWLVWVAACTGQIGDDDSSGAGASGPGGSEQALASPTLHRLTQVQLHNSWLDLLGEPLALPANLPADDQAYGFTSIAAAQKTISPLEAEEYETATYEVLDQVWADPLRREALVGCAATDTSEPCVSEFVERFASQAWRRPLAAGELDALLSLSDTIGASLADSNEGLKFGLAAVLQSPHFLFRVELGEPVPETPTLLRFTSFEMASRLSYLLLDAPPDSELRQAAELGELDDVTAVEAHARRLLADPRARPALTRFFRDFMNLSKLDTLDKDPEKFPQISATLGPAMRIEIEKMFEHVVFDDAGDFRRLFTSDQTFVNAELAALYAIEGVEGDTFSQVTLEPGSKRAGVLTSLGYLSLNAHKTQTSPTHRGRFVRINLLCEDVPPPPPGVSTTLPEPEPGAPPITLREKLSVHVEDPSCAACHQAMDPIGFAFEHFDALGLYRDVDENGLSIDAATEVDGQAVNGGIEMGELIAELPEVGACIARRFYEHGGAHLATSKEGESVDALVERFVASDYDFQALVVALVTNDGYRYASPEQGGEP